MTFHSGSVNGSFFPSIGCVNHYFLKKRAMAIGIMVGGSSLGGLVCGPVQCVQFVGVANRDLSDFE